MMKSLKVNNFQKPLNVSEMENQVLDYWDETKAFEKSVESRPKNKPYIFYDGPPFATGTPHYGHILASTAKDVVPRYWTMKGYRVERVWGWDCHGLPIENIVENELDLKGGKKGIEEMGIDKFNQACREAIWRFDKEWERVVRRIGRWVDFKNSYKTMDVTFMESVWWAFKQLYQKDLVYEGRRVILYCPRCSTPLSNFEIAMDNSYKELPSPSTTYKYKLKGEKDTYLLAWSTTPWNKLATPALAVNPDLDYVKIRQGKEQYILAEETLEKMIQDKPKYSIVERYKGKELEKFEFELHYDFFPEREGKKAGVVVADDYVSAQEGTGIVTLAVYGEDDYRVMLERDIQLVEHVDEQGFIKAQVKPYAGMFMLKTNKLVDQDLQDRNLIYHTHEVVHRVPVCYRCETRLYQAPLPAWFINISHLKDDLIKNNQDINWYPDHLKHGRFGKGLETAPDWNISRSRFWGTPMPIWVSNKQPHYAKASRGKQVASNKPLIRVIGSIDELKQWAVNPKQVENLTDIHREFVDDVEVWVDDARTEKGTRIPEVFDCWVESGSMPFASINYPFSNKDQFEASYPAQFIVEYIAQTRAWFYTLHVMSVAVFGKPAFENAVTTGNILAEDGRKMSKSKKNFPDPEPFFERYGVDALRFYLMGSVVMRGDNVNFSEQEVKEVYQKLINIVWNTFSFYKLYCPATVPAKPQPKHVLDRWIVSRTNTLIANVTESMDSYDTPKSCRLIQEYVTDLSTWYLRRSRDRLRQDKSAQQVFGWVLDRLLKVLAPFTPFLAETLYQNLHDSQESIHLENWPTSDQAAIDPELEQNMTLVRKIVESLHSLRQTQGIKVRQPLSVWSIDETHAKKLENKLELLEVVAEETNIKNFAQLSNDWYLPETPGNTVVKAMTNKTDLGDLTVYLDIEITQELADEGEARDLVRQIQQLRKKSGVALDDRIVVTLPSWPKAFAEFIKEKTLADELKQGKDLQVKQIG